AFSCVYGPGRTSADDARNASRSWPRSTVMYPRDTTMDECPRIAVMIAGSTFAANSSDPVVFLASCTWYRRPDGCATPASPHSAHGRVSEGRGDDRRVHLRRQQQRRRRVPGFVPVVPPPRRMRHPSLPAQRPPLLPVLLRVTRTPVRPRPHQPMRRHRRDLPPLLERLRHPVQHWDDPLAPLRLGPGQMPRPFEATCLVPVGDAEQVPVPVGVPECLELPGDVDLARVEVDVVPREAETLPLSHPLQEGGDPS